MPNRKRPRRDSKRKAPGVQPSEISNAILDLSNRAEWAKLAISKLKPVQADTDSPPPEQDGGGERDTDANDDRPSL